LANKTEFLQAVSEAIKGGGTEAVYSLYLTEGASQDFLVGLKAGLAMHIEDWRKARSLVFERPPNNQPKLVVPDVSSLGVITIRLASDDHGTLLPYGRKDGRYYLLGVRGLPTKMVCGNSLPKGRSQVGTSPGPGQAMGRYFEVVESGQRRRTNSVIEGYQTPRPW
jgi:hypothetical protein